jgi:hypothetical protein
VKPLFYRPKGIGGGVLVTGNLETVFAGQKSGFAGYPSFNTPDALADALVDLGVGVLTMANNHILDRGASGAKRTDEVLERAGILRTGTGGGILTAESAGLKAAFVNYSYGSNRQLKSSDVSLNTISNAAVTEGLSRARLSSPDIVVACFHWGNEYQTAPTKQQRALAALAAENGADLVIGTHPHVLQPVEVAASSEDIAARGVTAYSLGNFVSHQRTKPRERSVILAVDVEKSAEDAKARVVRVSVAPVWVSSRRVNGKPLIEVVYAGESPRFNHAGLPAAELAAARAAGKEVLAFLGVVESADEEGFYTLWIGRGHKEAPRPVIDEQLPPPTGSGPVVLEWLLSPAYDHAERFSEGLAAVKVRETWGYIDPRGKWVVPPLFSDAKPFRGGFAAVAVKNGEIAAWGFLTPQGKFLAAPLYEAAGSFSEGLAAVRSQGKWGYVGTEGQVVIPPKFDMAGEFYQGRAAVAFSGAHGFIDAKGEWLLQPRYSEAWPFAEDRAAVREWGANGKIGFIGLDGEWAVPPRFDETFRGRVFSEGLAGVMFQGIWGFVGHSGNWAVTPLYDGAWSFSEGLAAVRKGQKWGYIATSGRLEIEAVFDDAMSFSEGIAGVKFMDRWGCVDRQGAWAADPIYLELQPASEGLLPARSAGGRWGYLGRKLKPLFDAAFEEARSFSEGLAVVTYRGRKYFIDATGQPAFAASFENASDFSGGLAAVASGDQWGYIDPAGKWVIPPRFEAAGPFRGTEASGASSAGIAPARLKNRWGYIDRKGSWVIQNRYHYAWPFSEGLAAVRQGDKVGYIDAKGNAVIKPRFGVPRPEAEIGSFSEGLAAVLIGGKTGFVDRRGREAVKPVFLPWQTAAPRFLNGSALVAANEGPRYIDRGGKVLESSAASASLNSFPATIFPDLSSEPGDGGLVLFQSAFGGWGYAGPAGPEGRMRIVVPPVFDAALPFRNGSAAVARAGRWWYIAPPGVSGVPANPLSGERAPHP